MTGDSSLVSRAVLTRRVVATSKDSYTLRYFKVDQDEGEDKE